MIDDLEMVALVEDIRGYGLRAGDIGTVVHRYKGGETFEVEFINAEGRTYGMVLNGTD